MSQVKSTNESSSQIFRSSFSAQGAGYGFGFKVGDTSLGAGGSLGNINLKNESGVTQLSGTMMRLGYNLQVGGNPEISRSGGIDLLGAVISSDGTSEVAPFSYGNSDLTISGGLGDDQSSMSVESSDPNTIGLSGSMGAFGASVEMNVRQLSKTVNSGIEAFSQTIVNLVKNLIPNENK